MYTARSASLYGCLRTPPLPALAVGKVKHNAVHVPGVQCVFNACPQPKTTGGIGNLTTGSCVLGACAVLVYPQGR